FVANFAPGEIVPTGTYDPQASTWGADPNGLIFGVDRTGGGCVVEHGTALPPGTTDVTPAEHTQICGDDVHFPGGARFWRIPREPFSLPEANGPVGIAGALQEGSASSAASDPDSDCASGSILYCESRALGQRRPLVGTPFELSYHSARQVGRVDDHSVLVEP